MSSKNNNNRPIQKHVAWNLSLAANIIIDQNTANQRLDRFLRKYFRPYPDISLVMIFKAIRTGQIKVQISPSFPLLSERDVHKTFSNWKIDVRWEPLSARRGVGGRSTEWYKLKLWDTIIFHQSFLDLLTNKNPVTKRTSSLHRREGQWGSNSLKDFENRIISEDDNRLIINKPAGISIHPWQKIENWKLKIKNSESSILNSQLSLHDLIKQYYSSRGFAWSMFQPNVAYRLDKDTSGLVIVAKTYAGLQHLNEQIRDRKVDKMYYAIVVDTFPKQLTCNKSLKRIIDKQFGRGKTIVCSPSDPDAQTAHTIGYVEKTRSDSLLWPLSLVKVKITTGRMHQIRVHLADAGYPVLWDIVYGLPSFNRKLQKNHNILRQCLHCWCYSFVDMDGKMVSFEAPLLADMNKLIG